MGKKLTGILYVALAAMIYGFTPILARAAFDGGANGIAIAFLGESISLPVLFIVLRYKKIPLKPGEDWKLTLLTGVFGTALTTLSLYMSYNYISVGITTILHFVYPLLVSAAYAVFSRGKVNRWKITALILCSIGIFMFIDSISSFSITGTFLVLLSGGAYALYMVRMDKSQLKHVDYFQLTLYLNFLISVVAGIFGMFTGELHFSLTPKAWTLCALISLFIALSALSLTQRAIQPTEASTVTILSTLEPITSIVLGTLILKETVPFLKLTGCVFIIISILLIVVSEGRQDLPKLSSKTIEQHIS